MYSDIELTAYAYRSVLSHLIEVEERKDETADEIYPEPSAMRDDFIRFLDGYLKRLEELINSVHIIERPNREKLKTLNYLPYVIIGSTVTLESVDNLDIHLFKLVSPYDASDSDRALSFLSELGRALMLKKPGDIVEAQIGKTMSLYRIKSIRYE